MLSVIAGGAADPLLSAVPGTYAPGTAGNVIGNFLDAQVSTRQPRGAVVLANGSINDGTFAAVPDLIGPASGPVSMLQQLWFRFFGKTVYDKAGGTIQTFLASGPVRTTQAAVSSPAKDEVDAAT